MCGIVGAVAERNVVPILLEGLSRLEYRGYDSAGVAVINLQGGLERVRSVGKVKSLTEKMAETPSAKGQIGIAHTRWATHGIPEERNAHPHISNDFVSVVHNGIIENFQTLREELQGKGFVFTSDTDTEVIPHCIMDELTKTSDLYEAVKAAAARFQGAFSIGVVCKNDPDRLIAARKGSPLVIGVGIGEHFIASDVSALLPVTSEFIFLEEDDVAILTREACVIYDVNDELAERNIETSMLKPQSIELGQHKHFMHKEIFEQPKSLEDTLANRIYNNSLRVSAFGPEAESIFKEITNIQIVSCGTSYHAGLVAQYWFEDQLNIPCRVEVASEYRYRNPAIMDNTLFITISQSGETADTLAALRNAKKAAGDAMHTLSICNVPESSLTRESEIVFLTYAGPEIGVASTKAFSTQLAGLLMLLIAVGKSKGLIDSEREVAMVKQLQSAPNAIRKALQTEDEICELAKTFKHKTSAIFLGRDVMLPIAMEGALKLKEITYIHAESYAAGELKHGPLALIDEELPVIALSPTNALSEKLYSNLTEVASRGGPIFTFCDFKAKDDHFSVQQVAMNQSVEDLITPIVFNIMLQLLSYHVALQKGTDVDQPRNLAKSVTVE
jgi:glucosamine--fructose-6-phosphate aminotransferase (isomerizing)